MTSITATTAASSVWGSQATQQEPPPPRDGRRTDPLDSVTELLGKTKDELTTELSSGKSLSDVADAQGVSHEDLIAALEEGMPADAPSGVDPTTVLEAMASQVGGPRPPLPPAGKNLGGSVSSESGVVTGALTAGQRSAVSSLSTLLGTGADDLLAELQGGSDLLDMLQSKGITRSEASSTVGEGFLLDATA